MIVSSAISLVVGAIIGLTITHNASVQDSVQGSVQDNEQKTVLSANFNRQASTEQVPSIQSRDNDKRITASSAVVDILDSQQQLVEHVKTIEQLNDEISRLNSALDKALRAKDTDAKDMHAKDRHVASPKRDNKTRYSVDISIQTLENTIPEPFTQTVASLTGDFAKNFNDFHHQTQSQEWAYSMEDKIRDAISLNEQGINVQIESIRCKQSSCEVRGFQSEVVVWGKIAQDLMTESWWPFNYSHSTNNFHEDYGNYFFAILAI